MKIRIMLALLALALSGCATTQGPALPAPIKIEFEEAKP